MTKKVIIVKLGGAAITDKRGICQLSDPSQLEKTLNQVETAYQHLTQSGHQLILIHGAGSFGHPQAKQYNLKPGWTTSANYLKGFSHIRHCLQSLSQHICSSLESRNVPVLAMSPLDYIQTQDCEQTPTELFKPMAARVQQYLDLGFVPVLHGDAVLDQIRGCTILSGDIIMYQLTRLITVTRCIFVTDVNGIYKTDPKQDKTDKNPLITQILAQEQELQQSNNNTMVDVTGGMQGKIKWAKKIVLSDDKIDCIICKWGSKEALEMMSLEPIVKQDSYQMTIVTSTLESVVS
ncbi:Aspartate/glutamate/uridylate kinase [Thamnidium elegans]|uniref:Isopentenyl phosphate kinase n=1 Tax=Thamnidium elegans TaxID=101142 RepID=A0A8H7VV56_9FUNG|nr:hypothetical protein INT48_008547 [Thamnidium elegans]KAI8094647.1 Aspartate/glutamate/uridylate kinase [Thamnidium elegans]